jgi:sialate O-acetylesterase
MIPIKARMFLGALFVASQCQADVKLPALIGDHMLLQRDKPVRIFGTADVGEPVKVTFRGQSVQTTADALGRWELWLAPMKPAAPSEMNIQGKNSITVSDVLVGDVWLGSGQSNMQFAVRQANNAEQEINSANFAEIRLFDVPRKPSGVPVEDVESKWQVCTPETVNTFSAVLYFFGRQLHQDLKVPMGLIHTSWGGTPIAAWISGPSLTAAPQLAPFLSFWQDMIASYPDNFVRYQQADKKWEDNGKVGNRPAAPMGPGHPHEPTSLYNGMVAPLTKYTVEGALWYQGETEAGRGQGHIYGEALMTLVQDWRKAFGQGEFPFFWVQLANYGNAAKNGHWMKVQEGQMKATQLHGTGMAVINDIGAATNIHPTDKQDVGKRLALLARHVAYHQEGFEWSSPIYRQFTNEGSSLRVWFDHAGTGLKTRGDAPVKGFVIAGSDGKFVPAEAKIEGATVVVSSPEVSNPKAVRYAWDYNPDCNLTNSDGLPASLFRSDDRDEIVIK